MYHYDYAFFPHTMNKSIRQLKIVSEREMFIVRKESVYPHGNVEYDTEVMTFQQQCPRGLILGVVHTKSLNLSYHHLVGIT
jgi:hypothetical protein